MFGFQWHLSDRCNLRCRHCYQSDFSPASESSLEIRMAMADAIFTGIGDEEPVRIKLTGGEPLLLNDLPDLVDHLEKKPNLAEIHIITNGSIAEDSVLEKISKFKILTTVEISCESGNEEINDSIRGKGNLAMLRRNIPLYIERLHRPVVLMMTLGKHNTGTIQQTVDFARSAGANGLIFERFVPLGHGTMLSSQVLSAIDWRNAIKAITRASGEEVDADSLAAYRAFWLWFDRPEEDALEAALCNLGDHSMALMPDGTVFPCRRLQIPVGNVLKEPFVEIRKRLSNYNCVNLKKRLNGDTCGNCPFEDCPGCRALSNALSGDPWQDDIQCVLNVDPV
ncbi:MAG: radical SAM protein [Candidatus Riflebacteria bacterium]|nr:radical SAM protein [Candidatus Riflebacteria bacterium]